MIDDSARAGTLSEIVCEFRWGIQRPTTENIIPNPDYKIFLGKLFEGIQKRYPHLEPLEAAKAPEEIVKGVVQYRFRTAPDKFPLIQVGPGVYTVNHDASYKWPEFKKLVIEGLEYLYKNYPSPENLKDIKIVLTIINGVKFDYSKENVIDFLKEKFHLTLSIDSKLFKQKNFVKNPKYLDINLSISSIEPAGDFNLLVAPGKKKNEDAIVWHTTFRSDFSKLPDYPKDIENWLENANKILTEWR